MCNNYVAISHAISYYQVIQNVSFNCSGSTIFAFKSLSGADAGMETINLNLVCPTFVSLAGRWAQ